MLQASAHKSLLDDDTKALAKAMRLALEPIVEASPTIPLAYVLTLLAVAEREGMAVNEYAKDVGMLKAVATRHLLDLGVRDRRGNTGLEWIDQRRDSKDLRINRSYISVKGAAILGKMKRAMELFRPSTPAAS
jgi:DNA-binding MarR family transcriptional regulator